jgi:hypothetical protein
MYFFLFIMTDTITSQNTDLSSWDILYTKRPIQGPRLFLVAYETLTRVRYNMQTTYIYTQMGTDCGLFKLLRIRVTTDGVLTGN